MNKTKLKILTLFLMAFFVVGCAENAQTTTAPLKAENAQTTTEPFKIEVALKDYFNIMPEAFIIHLTDENNNIIKTQKSINYKNVLFQNVAAGKYKICTEEFKTEPPYNCEIFYNSNTTLDEKEGDLISDNAKINFKLPKYKSLIFNILDKDNQPYKFPQNFEQDNIACNYNGQIKSPKARIFKNKIIAHNVLNKTCYFLFKKDEQVYIYKDQKMVPFDTEKMPDQVGTGIEINKNDFEFTIKID